MDCANNESSVAPNHPNDDKRSLWWGPSWEKRKRMLHIEAWILVCCVYAAVIFAYAWPQDYRNTNTIYVGASWTAAIIRTFVFHVGIVVVLITIAASFSRCWKLFLVSAPLMVFMVGPAALSYWPAGSITPSGATLKVMSVNLLYTNQHTGPFTWNVLNESPDVILFQEYTSHWHEELQSNDNPKWGAIKEVFPHTCVAPREDSFGTAIYSKLPFVEKPNLRVPLGQATEPQVRAVIDFEGRPIALYNIHLLPPWGMEYTIEHRSQFADLLDVLKNEKLPTIMGGDFNFTENSANAADLKTIGFTDAHDQGGQGRGATWPVNSFFRWIPSIRLDHIYTSDAFVCTECRTGNCQGSDHLPVIARIAFTE